MPEYAHESKITARIDRELCQKVHNKFHHGQQTRFMRQVYQSVAQLIDQGDFVKVLDFMYRDGSLTLPMPKEKS